MTAMSEKWNPALVVSYVDEFYTTNDAVRRQELDRELCQFKNAFACEQTVSACIHLMNRANSASVQYFGAVSLYDTVRKRAEECIADASLMEGLKVFLIKNLSESAHIQMQSITNKLSSTLALLALYSIPDVWVEPVQDLTVEWSATPELLLRVLAEMAAEFCHVQMPLAQRSTLKTELHRISEYIIMIITTVMGSPDATASTRQAAVECVEQWLQLPGTRLDQWTAVLSVVFAAVSEDNAALTNLLNILAANDELSSMEQLVLDICCYITQVAAKKIGSELEADCDSEEVVSLVSAVCCLAEKSVSILIKYAKTQKSSHLIEICQLFVTLSSWPGRFPVEESISDLPAVFWTTLREELMATRTGSSSDKTSQVIASVRDSYAAVCSSAVTKLAYPSASDYEQFDSEQKEKFINYRANCSEIPVDAFHIVGDDTLRFLNNELESAVNKGDVCRVESVLYLWELVADYLSETQYREICQCMELCSRLFDVPAGVEGDRLGVTLMRLLFALSHLIQGHDNAVELESHALRIVLTYMKRQSVIGEALKTLEKYVEDRSQSLLSVGENISETCYTLFMDDSNQPKLRLVALKCIGYVLSMKPDGTILEVLNQLIAPHVSSLSANDNLIPEEDVDRRIFQISIFTCLFSTLKYEKKPVEAGVVGDSPVVSIFGQAMPVFRSLISCQGTATAIGDKVCEATRSFIHGLGAAEMPAVFPFVAELIDKSLLLNAAAASALAKSAVLVFGGSATTSNELCVSIARWCSVFESNTSHKDVEEWLKLMYHVVKKDWKLLRQHGDVSLPAIASSISVAGQALVSSSEPSVVRVASQVLATIANQTTSFSDERPRQLLASNGPPLVRAIFVRIQCELMRNTVEALAEVLFFFAKYFPAETRAVLAEEDNSDSPLVAAMFREVGNLRNFKQMALRLNQACRKSS